MAVGVAAAFLVIELFRGDADRGTLIYGLLSTSQFLSLVVIAAVLAMQLRLRRKSAKSC